MKLDRGVGKARHQGRRWRPLSVGLRRRPVDVSHAASGRRRRCPAARYVQPSNATNAVTKRMDINWIVSMLPIIGKFVRFPKIGVFTLKTPPSSQLKSVGMRRKLGKPADS